MYGGWCTKERPCLRFYKACQMSILSFQQDFLQPQGYETCQMMSNLTEMKLKWWWYVGWYYNQVTVEYENIWKIGMILDKIEKLFQSNFPQPGKMSLNVEY